MIHYSTNWMGPINMTWIKENGEGWSAGRIDVFGDGIETEMALPLMKTEDWHRFTPWLDKFSTVERVWTLYEIVEEYETTNPKITWWKKKVDKETSSKLGYSRIGMNNV